MSLIIGETIRNRVYSNGSHGNFSLAHGRHNVKAAEIGDTVELLQFEIGIKVHGVRVSSASGLGAGVKAAVKMGDKVLASNIDVSNALAKSFVVVPYSITQNEKLTVELTGAESTGDINVVLEYIAEGH